MTQKLLLIILTCCFVGCVAAPDDGQGGSSSSHGGATAQPREDLTACVAPSSISLSDIESVVEWINAMPKPLSLPCFIASLPRPLYFNATLSPLSAQSSVDRENPRFFFLIRQLVMSFVSQEKIETVVENGELVERWDADGKQLLELSYRVIGNFDKPQSIKAELAFPIYEDLEWSAPYSKILAEETSTNTLCSGCHNQEVVVDYVEGVPVFRSDMLRNPYSAEVPEDELLEYYGTCDPSDSETAWYRCRMYEATFGRGVMLWSSFAGDIATVF